MPPAAPLRIPQILKQKINVQIKRDVPRRRLVLHFARDEQGNNRSEHDHQMSHAVEEVVRATDKSDVERVSRFGRGEFG